MKKSPTPNHLIVDILKKKVTLDIHQAYALRVFLDREFFPKDAPPPDRGEIFDREIENSVGGAWLMPVRRLKESAHQLTPEQQGVLHRLDEDRMPPKSAEEQTSFDLLVKMRQKGFQDKINRDLEVSRLLDGFLSSLRKVFGRSDD